jgi:hypothetical protein
VSYYIGDRGMVSAVEFMKDVAGRIANRVQLTTDAHRPCLNAVEEAFDEVDYGQLIKLYGKTGEATAERKYSPPECIGIRKRAVRGNPDLANVSTSYVEKHNQTMRQHMKRFARLTAAHSKKIENHAHMIALYTTWYNFARINSAVKASPAMAAGIAETLWDIGDIVNLIDSMEIGEF